MPTVTFRILDGIDKGRVFRDLPTPVTIGREEGNLLRLNDERVSRFHAKVQNQVSSTGFNAKRSLRPWKSQSGRKAEIPFGCCN